MFVMTLCSHNDKMVVFMMIIDLYNDNIGLYMTVCIMTLYTVYM